MTHFALIARFAPTTPIMVFAAAVLAGGSPMQAVRIFILLVGLAVTLCGAYLLVLGIGAPIGIEALELGLLKASITGVTVGLVVACIGLAIMYLAMQFLKRTVERGGDRVVQSAPPQKSQEEQDQPSGGGSYGWERVVQNKGDAPF